MSKYLLCRPMGGLNDILCRIEACFSYAKKNNRKLILDTSFSGFLDDFSNYFSFKKYENEIIFMKDLDDSFFENKTMYPKIDLKISEIIPKWSMDHGKFVCSKTNTLLNFDFEKEYQEEILLFQQPGGGINSVSLIKNLHFTKAVSDFIYEKMQTMPEKYDGVHVRNSDYKTDYISFFETIKESLKDGSNLLICSDDLSCIKYAKSFFSDKAEIFSIAEIPDTEGKPLHMNKNLNRFETNLNCLLDLFALANAELLYTTNVTKGFPSGFTRLAAALHKEKDILNNLMMKG